MKLAELKPIPTPKEIAHTLQGLNLDAVTKLLTIWKYQIQREAIDESSLPERALFPHLEPTEF